MSNNRIKYLLEQYSNNSSTPEETYELFDWIKNSENNDDTLLKEKVHQIWEDHHNNEQQPDLDWAAIYSKIIRIPQINKRPIWPRLVAAAAIIGVILAGSYFFLINNNGNTPFEITSIVEHDIEAPETNRAMITLADGSVIYLDSVVVGQVASQKNVKIVKLPSGQIGYQSMGASTETTKMELNTLHNPKGSKVIEIMLSDGSLVWLNSGSSITYPVNFVENERSVDVAGEAYFEVAKDLLRPFVVKKDQLKVHVLGTHFNVNTYEDEDDIKVTLIEGSVRISDQKINTILTPGQQIRIDKNERFIIENSVNLEAVMAWKNGRFIFDGENIHTIMRQLARWYNIEVNYTGNVTNEKFVGVFSRSRYQSISNILKMFEKTRLVSFSMSEGKVTVMPFNDNKSMSLKN